MVDVVLISCPMVFSKDTFIGDESSNPWMGILYLAAYFKKNNISVKIYDPRAEKLLLGDIIGRLKKDKPKIVGLSALTSGLKSALEIAKKVRKINKKIFIGIGGSHINVDPEFIIRNPYFDFAIVGDAEITFTKIVKKILKGEGISKKIYQGEMIKNLDTLPFPARHLINIYDYFPLEKLNNREKPTATIVSSRGCPYHCCFCSRNEKWRRLRFRSAENIADEMALIASQYDGKFSFVDDAITLNRRIMLDLCKEIIKRKLKVSWMGMTRANLVDTELIKKMKRAGCEELFFGVESGSERIRNKVIHKNLSNREIKRAIRLCQENGIRVSVFLMMGFPTETKKDLEETVNFGLKFKPDFIGIHLTISLPGSEIFEIAKKERQVPANITDLFAQGKLGNNFLDCWPNYIPKGLSKEYLEEARKRAYRKFYLNKTWAWRRLKLWIKDKKTLVHDLGLIEKGIHVLIHGKSRSAAG